MYSGTADSAFVRGEDRKGCRFSRLLASQKGFASCLAAKSIHAPTRGTGSVRRTRAVDFVVTLAL